MNQANPPSTASQTPGEPRAASAPERLHRLPSTLGMVALGRTAWLDLVKARQAPQPVKIGRATAWLESELQQFIAERVRASRRGL